MTPVQSEDAEVVNNRSPGYANLGLKIVAGEYSFAFFFLCNVSRLTL